MQQAEQVITDEADEHLVHDLRFVLAVVEERLALDQIDCLACGNNQEENYLEARMAGTGHSDYEKTGPSADEDKVVEQTASVVLF